MLLWWSSAQQIKCKSTIFFLNEVIENSTNDVWSWYDANQFYFGYDTQCC